jgi:hypothetical protein
MGGKDVLYVREEHTSESDINDPASILKLLKETASMKFKDSADNHGSASEDFSNKKEVTRRIFVMTFSLVMLFSVNICDAFVSMSLLCNAKGVTN